MSSSAEETKLAKDMAVQADIQPMQQASLLWQYKNRGSIAGVPVQESSKGLSFQKQVQLMQAMQPVCDVQVFIGYLSPQHKEDVQKYTHIKQMAVEGSAVITQQQKQFVPQKSAYMCLVVYSMYRYKLNQRYNFYKEDFQNGKE